MTEVDTWDPTQEQDASVQALVEHTLFRGSDFVKVNRSAYPSALQAGDEVNVYVSGVHAAEFLTADPLRTGNTVPPPDGMIIVREVFENQLPKKVTVMVKVGAGYYPSGGDFYYAVLRPDGLGFVDDNQGQSLRGRIDSCADCHADRARDYFLFGVLPAHRHAF